MKRASSAFTLVEIMIVVATIGILIAIAVPGFLKARENSRLRACQENQTKIDSAVQQYILENNIANEAELGELWGYQIGIEGIETHLVGPTSYIRYLPVCPANGSYYVNTDGVWETPIVCLYGGPILHPYPGSTS